MKNLFLIILLLLLCAPVYAEYKPIPKNLSKQYKKEIEKIINNEYPKAIKKIDEYIKKANIYYNNVLIYGCYSNNEMNVINLNLLYEHDSGVLLSLYTKLVRKTQKKILRTKIYKFCLRMGRYIC